MRSAYEGGELLTAEVAEVAVRGPLDALAHALAAVALAHAPADVVRVAYGAASSGASTWTR